MSLSRTAATKNLGLNAEWDQCNSGFIKIYSGTAPANADASLSGNTLLSTLTFGATAFGAASAGVKTANAITSDSDAAATGTATFYRATKSDGTVVAQGSVGTSGADLNLNTTSIVQHGQVQCSSFVITAGA